MKKKHVVRLSLEERALVERLGQRSSSAEERRRALILLLVDQSPRGLGASDTRAASVARASVSTVVSLRRRFAAHGAEAAVRRASGSGRVNVLSSAALERLSSLTTSEPPAERSSWSVRLLADRLVEEGAVESVSHDTVWRALRVARPALAAPTFTVHHGGANTTRQAA